MKLLVENRDILDHIAGYLYRQETITGKEFMQIFCKMKGIEIPETKEEEPGARKAEVAAETAGEFLLGFNDELLNEEDENESSSADDISMESEEKTEISETAPAQESKAFNDGL
jgi:cell division protease FtsH